MKNIKLFGLLILGLFAFASCNSDDDDHDHEGEFEYHAHIMKPDAGMKMMGDTMHVHVEFEDHNGGTIHHINVRIYNKDTEEVIYSKPETAHIHETSGTYEFHDDVILNTANGFVAHGDYILEAKVWGHEAGEGENMETVEFHVHHM